MKNIILILLISVLIYLLKINENFISKRRISGLKNLMSLENDNLIDLNNDERFMYIYKNINV